MENNRLFSLWHVFEKKVSLPTTLISNIKHDRFCYQQISKSSKCQPIGIHSLCVAVLEYPKAIGKIYIKIQNVHVLSLNTKIRAIFRNLSN